jgi:hypothetical protein
VVYLKVVIAVLVAHRGLDYFMTRYAQCLDSGFRRNDGSA